MKYFLPNAKNTYKSSRAETKVSSKEIFHDEPPGMKSSVEIGRYQNIFKIWWDLIIQDFAHEKKGLKFSFKFDRQPLNFEVSKWDLIIIRHCCMFGRQKRPYLNKRMECYVISLTLARCIISHMYVCIAETQIPATCYPNKSTEFSQLTAQ